MDQFSANNHNNEQTQLSPQHTAVLVVDMLNDFCSEGGAMVLPGYEKLIEPQNKVIRTTRDAGGVIAYIIDSHRPQARRDREFLLRTPHCMEGTWGAEVVKELDQKDSDVHVIKRRYSAFFNTDLDLTLKDMEVDTVIVIGVVTNICVRSTVHDAFFHGYRVLVPEDCVAATSQREQDSSLYDIGTHFGLVTSSAAIADAMQSGAAVQNMIVA